jgi:hypothetical protein
MLAEAKGSGLARQAACLPELIAATKEPGAQVFATEGEKDVETAQELGLVATCNPFGALKWKDEYSLLLTGCDVIVSEDNDDRGRKHATKVARSSLRESSRGSFIGHRKGLCWC